MFRKVIRMLTRMVIYLVLLSGVFVDPFSLVCMAIRQTAHAYT